MGDDEKATPAAQGGVSAPPEESWLRRHVAELVIGIFVAIASFLSVRAINQIDSRLDRIEKDGTTLERSFRDYKKDAQKIHENLAKAIDVASQRFDKKTKETIRIILGVGLQQKDLESSLGKTQAVVQVTEQELKNLQARLAQTASRAEVESLSNQLKLVQGQVDDVGTQAKTLTVDSKSGDRDRILIEARRRLNQIDGQYLYSKAHTETIIRIPAAASLFGGTARILPEQEEYQVARTVEVDFQKGTLILRGRVKKQMTKEALSSFLGSIRGVDKVRDDELRVESPLPRE